MAWGYRCDLGCASWPDSKEYATCPVCEQECTRFSNLKPLDAEEARSMVAHLKFDEYYSARCDELGITSDGPIRKLGSDEPVPFEWPQAAAAT